MNYKKPDSTQLDPDSTQLDPIQPAPPVPDLITPPVPYSTAQPRLHNIR